MYPPGIDAAFHDSSAALVNDGRLVAAAEGSVAPGSRLIASRRCVTSTAPPGCRPSGMRTTRATTPAFGRTTGVPVLVNTSFNTRGQPIVCSPRAALEAFWTSPIDALVIGRFLIVKPESVP